MADKFFEIINVSYTFRKKNLNKINNYCFTNLKLTEGQQLFQTKNATDCLVV